MSQSTLQPASLDSESDPQPLLVAIFPYLCLSISFIFLVFLSWSSFAELICHLSARLRFGTSGLEYSSMEWASRKYRRVDGDGDGEESDADEGDENEDKALKPEPYANDHFLFSNAPKCTTTNTKDTVLSEDTATPLLFEDQDQDESNKHTYEPLTPSPSTSTSNNQNHDQGRKHSTVSAYLNLEHHRRIRHRPVIFGSASDAETKAAITGWLNNLVEKAVRSFESLHDTRTSTSTSTSTT
ncbi:hypothetical protein BJX99DRAFT_253349 [Aspergillus californicus]